MPRIRAVVFDLFDTLVDLLMENIPYRDYGGRPIPGTAFDLHDALAEHYPVDFDRFARAMGAVDREFRKTYYEQGRELPTRERFRALMQKLGIDEPGMVDRLTDVQMQGVCAQVRFLEHHPVVLAELNEHCRIALCSNFSHAPTVRDVLERSALAEYFHAIVVSEDVGIRKPRPEIFEAVLDALDVAAPEALHVGDSLRADVGGAAALGIRTVWITRRIADPAAALRQYTGTPPDWQIDDLAQLPRLLAGLDSSAHGVSADGDS